ncbi:MAG: DEAD/DEAH box helicase family protein [Ignavibacteria bacterium]|nr:DEAD/DEAH box helicase family protein [Ignavibacteria bacterium]
MNPQKGQYTLFGKTIKVSGKVNNYNIDDKKYEELIEDYKRQFPVYIKIFELRNKQKNMNTNIIEIQKLLEHKNQIILQGAPGTGKTYTAKDIAEQIIFGSISSDKTLPKFKT